MIKKKLPQKEVKKNSLEDPDTMQPLKFPKITGQKISKKKKTTFKLSRKTIIVFVSIVAVILSIGGGVWYFTQSGGITINIFINDFFSQDIFPSALTPKISDNPETPDYNPQIILYLETETDTWEPLEEEELSTLKAGDVIRIAVSTQQPANRIDIFVNEKSIPLANGLTPNQEPYARYIIPQDKSEYEVAARVY
jgi:hypothetical protein